MFISYFLLCFERLSKLIILYLVHELTYIDREDLADFLCTIEHVVYDWRKLQHVLGTKPAVYSRIENKVKTDLSSIPQAISELLCVWNGGTGLYGSTVSLLCYGSEVPVGKVLTEGLERHGFVLAVGSENDTENIRKAMCA
jgi:hypothetical protein